MGNKKINNKVLKNIIFEQFSLNEDIIKDLAKIKDKNKPVFIAKNADKFDINNFPKNLLPTFTDEDIFSTIYYNEDLVSVFDKKDIDKMSEELLAKLLYNKPKIVGSPNLPLDKLESQSVLGLVYNHPDMVDKLPTDKLESEDIAKILYHDKKGFMFRMLDLSKLKSEDIRNLIYNKPNYITTLPTKNLTADDITKLIYYNLAFLTDPTLAGLDLSKLDKSRINKLTKRHGNISQYFGGKASNTTNTTTSGSTTNASSTASNATKKTTTSGSKAKTTNTSNRTTNASGGLGSATTSNTNNSKKSNDVKNDQVVIEQITKDAQSYTMETFPRQYIQYFTENNIVDVLIRNVGLFGLFNRLDLDKITPKYIAVIIIKQPILSSEFNLEIFDSQMIGGMIYHNPSLIKQFTRDKLNTLKSVDVQKIIDKHPNLAKYF